MRLKQGLSGAYFGMGLVWKGVSKKMTNHRSGRLVPGGSCHFVASYDWAYSNYKGSCGDHNNIGYEPRYIYVPSASEYRASIGSLRALKSFLHGFVRFTGVYWVSRSFP